MLVATHPLILQKRKVESQDRVVPSMLYCEVVTEQDLGHQDPKSEDFSSSDKMSKRGLSEVEQEMQDAAGKVGFCANSKDRDFLMALVRLSDLCEVRR